jgi:hypothetical protein
MSSEEVTPERFAKLEERLARTERSLCRLRCRQRTCNLLALLALLFSLYGGSFNALKARVLALEGKTANMLALTDPNTGQPTVRFSGVNVQIVNGAGETEAPPEIEQINGVGNLIVGYNESRRDHDDKRTGSHNLIVGWGNNYTGVGGVVFGCENSVSAKYATVTGGTMNESSNNFTSVTGGFGNEATEDCATVSGGQDNIANGSSSSIAGGFRNSANHTYAHVSGGSRNEANGYGSFIGGGNDVIVNQHPGLSDTEE